MIAIVGGLATAVLWAMTLLASARAARLIGAWSTLAWVMLIGLAVALPFVLLTGLSVSLTGSDMLKLAVAGFANTGGLLLGYAAIRRGKVAVVGPIVSTEGAIGAVLAIIAGDPLTAAAGALLAIIAIGVVLASVEQPSARVTSAGDTRPNPDETGRSAAVTACLALGAALLFGINLFVTSRIADTLPLAWSILPARLAGVVAVSVPLIVTRRLQLTRPAAPFLVIVGLAEVAGIATYAIGSRDSAPVASVLASQFAGIAAVAAFVLFGERLSRVQVAGVVVIAVGVAALAAVRAF
ncbi:MAG TPA: DMT family transporter [Candidatus Limnocylindrales bacterium]|nr:DMT family transporter [Candidatus Limnocylindrales bacterium]